MNEDRNKTKENEFTLAPLGSGQHAVTPVPKSTTDLPFFYLTKHKERLMKPILYEGVDGEGRPMRWAATPNAAIGSPGIDAHEAWTRLVKPTWEAYRTDDDRLPNILPLGGVRQCLRGVGWGQGGWEARRLLRALNQIGATWCTADFSVPTTKLNEDGRPTFRLVKGSFSRLTIYAIGEKHLTEDELKDGSFAFEFNLEDTLYVQFHPFEVAIQESQPQRYLDNQYMFSVRAAGRRWYELMAAKMFGVVKNNGQFCEVLYSWYVKHHHTLNRLTTRRRIVQQINEVVHDHLNSQFLDRIEYRKLSEPGKQIDFLIRFYPGAAARQSVARVGSSLQKKRMLPAGKPRAFFRKRQALPTPANENETKNSTQVPLQKPVDRPGVETGQPDASNLSDSMLSIAEALSARGIFRSQAVKLVSTLSVDRVEQVMDYVEYWDAQHQAGRVTPGLLYELVRNGDPLPPGFETSRQRTERLKAVDHRVKLEKIEQMLNSRYDAQRREAVDRYIRETLPVAEFEERVAARRAEILANPGFWDQRPETAEQFAHHEIRAEIGRGAVQLSPEEFRRTELPKILADLKLDATAFGIGEAKMDTAQNAPNEPSTGDTSQDRGFPVSEESSSLRGV